MFPPKNLSITKSLKLCLGRSELAPLKKGGWGDRICSKDSDLASGDCKSQLDKQNPPTQVKTIDFPSVRAGGLQLCSREFYSPKLDARCEKERNWFKHTKWLLIGVLATGAIATEAIAHKVEISGDVGGTIHLEPNDNPQAGKATLAWIALTRKGGQTIPLQHCNCQLAVYAQPRQKDATPLLKPSLKPVSAEKYQGVPGAEIVFPKPGAYQVELKGTPKAGANFKPFQLNFEIVVATRS